MRKIYLSALLVLICRLCHAQSSATFYASAPAGSFITGSATTTTRTDDNIECSSGRKGYAVFDLSSLPPGSDITACVIYIYKSAFTAGTAGLCNTFGYAGDLSTVTDPAALFTAISSGPLLFSAMPDDDDGYGTGTGYDSLHGESAPITSFIQSNIGGKVTIGFTGGGSNEYTMMGETGPASWAGPGMAPQMRVYYIPPCSGTPSTTYVNVTTPTACSTTPFTVSVPSITSVTGINYQWQSSPDSAAWTDISGATSTSYSVAGISATTYYRMIATCSFSGLTSVSPGRKVLFLSCCTGTPASGTASASTASCTACTLTLTLTGGEPPMTGLSKRWQLSADGSTWTDVMPPYFDGTVSPYSFTPFGPYYYRHKTTCLLSSSTVYTSPVFVDYRFTFAVADSIRTSPWYMCLSPELYARVNGSSPLLRIKTYYGDGTTDSLAVSADTLHSHLSNPHSYYSSGTYTIKRVLYYNNVPQDSVEFPFAYTHCNVLGAAFFHDLDGDCIDDGDESQNSTNLRVTVDSNGIRIDTLYATTGFGFKTMAPIGTIYTYTVLAPGVFVSCPASGTWSDTVLWAMAPHSYKRIALNCVSTTDFDLSASTSRRYAANVGRNALVISNKFCEPTDAHVTLTFTPRYNVLRTFSPPPFSLVNNVATWILPNVAATDSVFTIRSYLYATPLITVGDTVHTYLTITPTAGDMDPSDNSFIFVDTVEGPYDPNDITVVPAGCIYSDTATRLHYTVHFENVGNAPAENVYISDTLSEHHVLNSLELDGASHNMHTYLYQDGAYKIVKFDFPGINLADSSDHIGRTGFVSYYIYTKPSLPSGTEVRNHAGIFFDYNPAVVTNTALNFIDCPPAAITTLAGSAIASVYPNPATDELTINATAGYSRYVISNMVGQQLLHGHIPGNKATVKISSLPVGIYQVTLSGDSGSTTLKFIKAEN